MTHAQFDVANDKISDIQPGRLKLFSGNYHADNLANLCRIKSPLSLKIDIIVIF